MPRVGVEPTRPVGHPGLSRARLPVPATEAWWCWSASNRHPRGLQPRALPPELQHHGAQHRGRTGASDVPGRCSATELVGRGGPPGPGSWCPPPADEADQPLGAPTRNRTWVAPLRAACLPARRSGRAPTGMPRPGGVPVLAVRLGPRVCQPAREGACVPTIGSRGASQGQPALKSCATRRRSYPGRDSNPQAPSGAPVPETGVSARFHHQGLPPFRRVVLRTLGGNRTHIFGSVDRRRVRWTTRVGAPEGAWWRRPDSNRRPPGYEPGELTELLYSATGRGGRTIHLTSPEPHPEVPVGHAPTGAYHPGSARPGVAATTVRGGCAPLAGLHGLHLPWIRA